MSTWWIRERRFSWRTDQHLVRRITRQYRPKPCDCLHTFPFIDQQRHDIARLQHPDCCRGLPHGCGHRPAATLRFGGTLGLGRCSRGNSRGCS